MHNTRHMPRSKAQDAERKRLSYANNEEYRIRHKEKMRLYYHQRKAELAILREQIRQAESDSDTTASTALTVTDTEMSSPASDTSMGSAESQTSDTSMVSAQ